MEELDFGTDDLVTETYNNRIALIILITCAVANLIGAVSNFIIFGFTLTTIYCVVCLGLVLLLLGYSLIKKKYNIPTYIAVVLVSIFEIPFLFYSYRLSAAPYLVLGLYSIGLIFSGRTRIGLWVFAGVIYIVSIVVAIVYPTIYNNIDEITLLISGLVSTTITAVTITLTVTLCLENYKYKTAEYREVAGRLNRISRYDALAPCFNRKYLMDYLYAQSASRFTSGISIIMFHIVDIIYINQKWSYQVGDDFLVNFTNICNNNVRNLGIVTRFDGEKFVIVLNVTNEDEVKRIVEQICQEYKEYGKKSKSEDFGIAYGISVCDRRFSVDEEMKNCVNRCFDMSSKIKKKVVEFNAKK